MKRNSISKTSIKGEVMEAEMLGWLFDLAG